MSLSVCGEDRTLGMTRLDIDVFFDRHLAEKRRLYLANGSSWICTQASSHGRCMRGPSCPYKHTRNLQPPVCKFWLRGGCKRGADACGDLHIYDMNRMPLCQFMSEHGVCHNAECAFIHEKPPDVIDCPAYTNGFCPRGHKCRNRHIARDICGDYLAGFCRAGPACTHAHPIWTNPLAAATTAATAMRDPNACFRCGQLGHIASQCFIRGNTR